MGNKTSHIANGYKEGILIKVEFPPNRMQRNIEFEELARGAHKSFEQEVGKPEACIYVKTKEGVSLVQKFKVGVDCGVIIDKNGQLQGSWRGNIWHDQQGKYHKP